MIYKIISKKKVFNNALKVKLSVTLRKFEKIINECLLSTKDLYLKNAKVFVRKPDTRTLLHSTTCCFVSTTHACTWRVRPKKMSSATDMCMLHTHTYVRHTYTRMRAFTCISIPLTGISSIACLGMNEPLRHALVLTGPLPQPSSSFSSSSSSTSSFSRNPLAPSPRSRLSLF